MRRMYLLTVIIVLLITILFLLVPDNNGQVALLQRLGYSTKGIPCAQESFRIPDEFDKSYLDYNIIQLSQGMDLYKYRGRYVTKYSYEITNCKELSVPIYANFITYCGRIIAKDLTNPRIDGFTLPLIHRSELIKYCNRSSKEKNITTGR